MAGKINKAGPGRPKGSQNLITVTIKQAVEQALHNFPNGGAVGYFEQQRDKNPKAFLALLARIIPNQVMLSGDNNGQPLFKVVFETIKDEDIKIINDAVIEDERNNK